MPVRSYCRCDPVTASPDDSIRDAATRMEARGVGSLVVVDSDRRPVGVVTDRDLVLSSVHRRLDTNETPLREVMSAPPVVVSGGSPIGVAIRFMRRYRLRRVPVVEDVSGALEGILTSDDVVGLLSRELAGVSEVVRSQMPRDAAEPAPGARAEGR